MHASSTRPCSAAHRPATAQRSRHHAAERGEVGSIVGRRGLAIEAFLWGFQNHRNASQHRVIHDQPKSFAPDGALANCLVAINPGTPPLLGIIGVDDHESLDPDKRVEEMKRCVEIFSWGERIAGGKYVARIEAYTHAFAETRNRINVLKQSRNLFKSSTKARALAGGRLD